MAPQPSERNPHTAEITVTVLTNTAIVFLECGIMLERAASKAEFEVHFMGKITKPKTVSDLSEPVIIGDDNEPKTGPKTEAKTLLRIRKHDDCFPEPSEWALVIYSGKQLGRVFPLGMGDTIIGRSSTATIPVQDEETSRTHCMVSLSKTDAGDVLFLEDLESTNGTFLNGVLLRERHPVYAGDRIALGGHVLKLVSMDVLEKRFHTTMLSQSTRDALTGVMNRAAVLEELHTRFELCKRHTHALAVIMCDLDHFKQVNDTHGHGAGDEVLTQFGKLLLGTLRNIDLVGRIGGEEFLIILPDTDTEGARILAERIRSAMEGVVHTLETGELRVTCSLGIAEYTKFDQEAGVLMGRADGALYKAKHQGRNRVICAPVRTN